SRRESAAPDGAEDLIDGELRHRARSLRQPEERRRDLVHLRVRRLRRKQNRDEKREGIFMRERNGRKRIEAVQNFRDFLGFFELFHDGRNGTMGPMGPMGRKRTPPIGPIGWHPWGETVLGPINPIGPIGWDLWGETVLRL